MQGKQEYVDTLLEALKQTSEALYTIERLSDIEEVYDISEPCKKALYIRRLNAFGSVSNAHDKIQGMLTELLHDILWK